MKRDRKKSKNQKLFNKTLKLSDISTPQNRNKIKTYQKMQRVLSVGLFSKFKIFKIFGGVWQIMRKYKYLEG